MDTQRQADKRVRVYRSFGGEDAPTPPRQQKALPYSYTTLWEGTCPRCGHELNQENVRCRIDDSYLVVRQNAGPSEPPNLLLGAFQFTRMVGRQELRCSGNDGFHTTSVACPECGAPVQGDYLRGIYTAPRRILYVPFVLLLTLGVVRATSGLAILLWPVLTWFFGWIYRFVLCRSCPRPIRSLFTQQVAYSFYDTNEAHQL